MFKDDYNEPTQYRVPPAIPAWHNSFEHLKPEDMNFMQSSTWKADRRFVAPKPQIFYNVDLEKLFRMLRVWKAIADPWLDTTANGYDAGRMLDSHEWRVLLNHNKNGYLQHPVSTKTEDVSASVLRELDIRLRIMRQPEPDFEAIYRTTSSDARHDRLDEQSVRYILWKLCELNFKFELLSLDRRICKPGVRHRSMSNEEWMITRESKVLRCFYGRSLGRTHIFNAHPEFARKGLANPEWKERLPFVRALWDLIMDWDIEIPRALQIELEEWVSMNEKGFLLKERAIVVCYCKSFYDSFCRLPTVPRTLSPEDIQVALKAAK